MVFMVTLTTALILIMDTADRCPGAGKRNSTTFTATKRAMGKATRAMPAMMGGANTHCPGTGAAEAMVVAADAARS
jgi:hypothetical protein